MNRFPVLILSVIFAVSVLVTSCSDVTDPGPSASAIHLPDSELVLDRVGDEYVVEAQVEDRSGDLIEVDLEWSSSNTGVAEVQDGVITAAGHGEATITASHRSISASLAVRVNLAPAMIEVHPAPPSQATAGDVLEARVRVDDQDGFPVPGQVVEAQVSHGQVSIGDATDGQGEVDLIWHLPETALDWAILTVFVGPDLAAEYQVEVVSGAPARLAVLEEGSASGVPDTPLATPYRFPRRPGQCCGSHEYSGASWAAGPESPLGSGAS